MTLVYDIVINQGETWELTFPVIDSAKAPVTVDGWTAKGQIRRGPDDPVLHEWSATASNLVVAGTTVVVSLTPSVSSAWTWTRATYDLELTDPSGHVYRLAQGSVRVSPEITH